MQVQAIIEPSITRNFADRVQRRVTRDVMCYVGDSVLKLPSGHDLLTKVGQNLASINAQAVGYDRLFGIGNATYGEIGAGKQFTSYTQFFKGTDGREIFKQGLKYNFETFLNPEYCKKFTPTSYFKETMIADNVKSITSPLLDGKLISSAVRAFFAGLTAWGVIKDSVKAYREKSLISAIGTFATGTIKSFFVWEAGTVGGYIGTALVPVAGLSWIGGVLGCALLGAIAYKASSKL